MSIVFKLGVVPLVVLVGYSLLHYPVHDDIPEKQARHWVNDCRLVEKNIDNGLFSSEQNRLQCGDVVENVNADDYDHVINGKENTTIAEIIQDIFNEIFTNKKG